MDSDYTSLARAAEANGRAKSMPVSYLPTGLVAPEWGWAGRRREVEWKF